MPEDRDHLFEKALARQLRAAAESASACPDPETLAAYHERLLSAEEMTSAKEHLISCARCQEILAHLEATDLVESRDAVTVQAALAGAAPSRTVPMPELTRAAPAADVLPAKVTSITKRSATLRWAAPFGAIAAVLLLWVGTREFRQQKTQSEPASQIADNRKNEQSFPAPTQPPAGHDELRQQASPGFSQDDKESISAPHSSAEESERAPAKRAVIEPRKDSVTAREGFGSGAGNAPREKSIIAQETTAAPSIDANNADKAAAVSGGAAGAMMAKKAPAPAAPNPDSNYKAETKSKEDRDKLADSFEKPDAATKARASAGYIRPAPQPPSPAKPAAGNLRGQVTDPSGAAVSGAQVALKSETGGTVAQTSTDSSGTYALNGIVAGNYQLELQSTGFKTDNVTGVNIAGGENVMNAQLQPGASSETVEVAAQSNTRSSNSQVAESTTAPKLQGRNFQALVLASAGLQSVSSPDGKAVWKFGDAGQIFHSKNSGKDWIAQSSGVAAKLLAASAPTSKVCWIAGASGTLVRTTDGGKHWRLINAPIIGDLGGVRAADLDHATIWDASRQKYYQTSDGGSSWQPAAGSQ